MNARHLLVAAAAAFCCTAGAQMLKPGLWEVTHTMGDGQVDNRISQLQQQMAGMPPEQRKMMEEMMAKQGVKMGPGGSAAGAGMKVCLTREMVERNELPAQQGDCQTTHQSRSGSNMKFGFSCSSPPSRGEGEVTFISPEAYRMKMVVTSQARGGKPEQMKMGGGGKWLGADCGNIKPIMPPATRTVPPAKTVLPAAR